MVHQPMHCPTINQQSCWPTVYGATVGWLLASALTNMYNQTTLHASVTCQRHVSGVSFMPFNIISKIYFWKANVNTVYLLYGLWHLSLNHATKYHVL